MPDETTRGPLLADTEDVYRALFAGWWPDGMTRPSSAAFDFEVFSVDVKSKTTPQQTAGRFNNVTRLAEFNCGAGKAVGFDSHDELDPAQPENLAHAHVYMRDYHATNPSQRKKKARKLAEICKLVAV